LKQASEIAGSGLHKLERELGTNFDPKVYDRKMEQFFDDQYYGTTETEKKKEILKETAAE